MVQRIYEKFDRKKAEAMAGGKIAANIAQ